MHLWDSQAVRYFILHDYSKKEKTLLHSYENSGSWHINAVKAIWYAQKKKWKQLQQVNKEQRV